MAASSTIYNRRLCGGATIAATSTKRCSLVALAAYTTACVAQQTDGQWARLGDAFNSCSSMVLSGPVGVNITARDPFPVPDVVRPLLLNGHNTIYGVLQSSDHKLGLSGQSDSGGWGTSLSNTLDLRLVNTLQCANSAPVYFPYLIVLALEPTGTDTNVFGLQYTGSYASRQYTMSFTGNDTIVSMACYTDVFWLLSRSGNLTRIATATGSIIDRTYFPSLADSTSLVMMDGGTAAASTATSVALLVADLFTGSPPVQMWRTPIAAVVRPVIYDPTQALVIAVNASSIVALDFVSGDVYWEATMPLSDTGYVGDRTYLAALHLYNHRMVVSVTDSTGTQFFAMSTKSGVIGATGRTAPGEQVVATPWAGIVFGSDFGTFYTTLVSQSTPVTTTVAAFNVNASTKAITPAGGRLVVDMGGQTDVELAVGPRDGQLLVSGKNLRYIVYEVGGTGSPPMSGIMMSA